MKDKFYCTQIYYHLEEQKYKVVKIAFSPGSRKGGKVNSIFEDSRELGIPMSKKLRSVKIEGRWK